MTGIGRGGWTPDEPVLVVGAGPAGSSLALRLARRGLPVRLLDARTFPRSKPCGDSLSPGASPLLRELGVLEEIRRHRPARLRGWRIRTPGGRWFDGRFSPRRGRGPAYGLALPRRTLDAVLLRAAVEAGADFRPGERVFRLLHRGDRVVGAVVRDGEGRVRRHSASLVVGADGLRSSVARRAAGVDRGPRRRLALVGRYRGVSRPGMHGELRLTRDGVVGSAPAGQGRMNVTVVAPADRAPEISRDREAFFRDRLRRTDSTERLSGGGRDGALEITGPFEVSPRRVAGPGFLLVGDAAGYFDPLTGQGIFRALVTARLAAATVPALLAARPAPGRPEDSDGAGVTARERALTERYVRTLERILVPGRRVQWMVDTVLGRPVLTEGAGAGLGRASGLTSLLLEVTGDRLPPSALLRPDRLVRACLASRQSGSRDDGRAETRPEVKWSRFTHRAARSGPGVPDAPARRTRADARDELT